MGRYYWNKKKRTSYYNALDVYWLNKNNYFCGSKYGGVRWINNRTKKSDSSVGMLAIVNGTESYIKFAYSVEKTSHETIHYKYKIQLVTTVCTYGGLRYWFICPGMTNKNSCGRRVAKLYLGEQYFSCRHCYRLCYNSQNVSKYGRYGYIAEYHRYNSWAEQLSKTVKISHRAGKVTRKYRRVLQLRSLAEKNCQLFSKASK